MRRKWEENLKGNYNPNDMKQMIDLTKDRKNFERTILENLFSSKRIIDCSLYICVRSIENENANTKQRYEKGKKTETKIGKGKEKVFFFFFFFFLKWSNNHLSKQ